MERTTTIRRFRVALLLAAVTTSLLLAGGSANASFELGADCLPGSVSDTTPQSKACYTFTGGCTIVEHTTTTSTHNGTGWFLRLFWNYDKVTTSTKIVSTVDCNGSITYTIAHWGGIGLRAATSKMVLAGAQTSSMATNWQLADLGDITKIEVECDAAGSCVTSAVANNAGKEVESCEYVGGLASCSTTHQGNWEAHFETGGRVTNLKFCGDIETFNELAVPVGGLLSGGAKHAPCWAPTVQYVNGNAVATR